MIINELPLHLEKTFTLELLSGLEKVGSLRKKVRWENE